MARLLPRRRTQGFVVEETVEGLPEMEGEVSSFSYGEFGQDGERLRRRNLTSPRAEVECRCVLEMWRTEFCRTIPVHLELMIVLK